MRSSLGGAFINLIYPLKCQVCSAALRYVAAGGLCFNCRQEIGANLPHTYKKNGSLENDLSGRRKTNPRNLAHIDGAWCACGYGDQVKILIHSLKYKGRLRLVDFVCELCADFAKKYIAMDRVDYLTCVPMDRQKKRQRGFNQSELIAGGVAKYFGIPFLDKALIKVKATKPQVELDGHERLVNLTKAFKVNPKMAARLKGKNILIVDDVMTTGSTLNECAGCLKAAGSGEVLTLALAGGD